MQKKIIALAIAAAFSAPAFADTTAYGIVDAAIAHLSADGQRSDTQLVSGGLSTSRVGLKSVEDLGNGMKSLVVVEYKIDAQTNQQNTASASNLSARQQMLGLTGEFGTVATGFLQTTGYDWSVKYNPVEGSTVSPLGNVTKGGGFLIGSVAAASRAQRAIAYISNDFSGFNFAVNYTTAFAATTATQGTLGDLTVLNATASTKYTAWLASANYATGPVAVGAVYAKLVSADGATDKKEYALGGSYDFGVAKLLATYQSMTAVVANSSGKATSIGVVVPAGSGAVVGSYASNKMDNTAGGVAQSAKGMTVAYLYNLSKDDTVYAAYSKMSQDVGTAAYSVDNNYATTTMTAGGGSSMVAVGLRKKF